MKIIISEDKYKAGKEAALKGAEIISKSIKTKGQAHILVATGASQFEMLENLVKEPIEWPKVTAFHLDEYIGLPFAHPASFRRYLKERFVDKVNLNEFIYINGEKDPAEECSRISENISEVKIDVAFVGIGENAHLAFNDPPADFSTENPYIVVQLTEECRKQQLGEGWFNTLDEVPQKAISISVAQIMKSNSIICTVPDLRKARAVKLALENGITPDIPASILKNHKAVWIYLDKDSSSLLKDK